MKKSDLETYRCPQTKEKLNLMNEVSQGDRIKEGILTNSIGEKFIISDFIPDFTWPKHLAINDEKTKITYDNLAKDYDKFANIPFLTFKESNEEIREKITSKLQLKSNSKVLEIGGGDGRGAEYILKYIPEGKLYFQELSPSFLRSAINRLENFKENIEFSIANASYLSFPDNYFDAAHHFGGISTFDEKEKCLAELARVVKPGGKIVIGDEGIGPWLKETEMAKIMINSNPLIGVELPTSSLPVSARNVSIEWILMGAYYMIDFTVGEGEPKPNYHINIPSKRGGTHWTRYHGNLEGVSDEVKELALKEIEKNGMSMHDWLESIIKKNAT